MGDRLEYINHYFRIYSMILKRIRLIMLLYCDVRVVCISLYTNSNLEGVLIVKVIALLRGVMPTGKNRIPKMTDLVEILENAGFKDVQTYIQSGNVLLETNLSYSETASKIHNTIFQEIGAELSVIIKTKEEFAIAIEENPFDDSYDFSRIHLVFTNNEIDSAKVKNLNDTVFEGEILSAGNECFYMYLPRDAVRKRLNNKYITKQIPIYIVDLMNNFNIIRNKCTFDVI